MKYGFVKIAASTPELKAGDVSHNSKAIIEAISEANAAGAQILVTPELSITGATCQNLFSQRAFVDSCENALLNIAQATKTRDILAFVGLPLRVDDKIFNTVAAVGGGKIIAIVPKTFDSGNFASAKDNFYDVVTVGGNAIPFSSEIIMTNLKDSDLNISVIIGETMFQPLSDIETAVANGANLIINPTAALDTVENPRKAVLSALSRRTKSAIISVSSGFGESTRYGVYSGQKIAVENGNVLFSHSDDIKTAITDVDSEMLINARTRAPLSFPQKPHAYDFVDIELSQNENFVLNRTVPKLPFVPVDVNSFSDALDILSKGIYSRMKSAGVFKAVIGLSGGIDSTAALLELTNMCDKFDIPRSEITAVTMSGFGSSNRTKDNAEKLISCLKISHRDIPISDAVKAHLKQIDCDDMTSLTAENAQARERAQILFDLANMEGALVIGTSDMSEIALGWSTYGGDQLAHFNPNAGLPKTYLKALLRFYTFFTSDKNLAAVIADILNTPISPELLKGQVTEKIIGPYELHDFFIYNILYKGFSPKKTLYLASIAFPNYAQSFVKKTLKLFLTRFFSNQFKRNASCDGIKIFDFALSDLDLGSDLSAQGYLDLLS